MTVLKKNYWKIQSWQNGIDKVHFNLNQKLKKAIKISLLLGFLSLLIITYFIYTSYLTGPADIVSIRLNPDSINVSLYWKQPNGKLYGNIGQLKMELEKQKKKLIFATNGGMFDKKQTPVGLFVENGKQVIQVNTKEINPDKDGNIPNFYLNPNGVFFVTFTNKVGICKTSLFRQDSLTKFATQSGPMLLIEGKINPAFSQKSNNYHIRNGVGILPDNDLIFAISKNKVTFYDFANYFKEQGCINALFLDGYVSKAFIPEQGVEQLDGDLGVIIGITEK
jgi:uncharacterized protein YigE (DUF2233 family)